MLGLGRRFGGGCAYLSCGSPDKAGSFRLLPECERLGGAANDRTDHRRFKNTMSLPYECWKRDAIRILTDF